MNEGSGVAVAVMVLGGILCLIVGITIMLPFGFVAACRRGRRILASVLGILCVLVFAGDAYIVHIALENVPLGDKRVAELRTEGGAELVVHQECNYSFEPYTTTFYYRSSPSNQWRGYYMDHEDDRWHSGRIDFDEQQQEATIRRGEEIVASFDANARAFTLGTYTTTQCWSLAYGASLPGGEIKK